VVGNHGAEAGHSPIDRTCRTRLAGWRRFLQRELSLVPGIDVEDKGLSIAVHYRQVPCRAAGRHLVLRAAGALEGARVLSGHAVVNVLDAGAPDKGTALEAVVRRAGPRPVLYVGDDRTDEHVFCSSHVEVAVRVGRTSRSAAPWYLSGQQAVDDLLALLLAARSRLDGLGDRSEGLARAVGV
jgi:trehalose 6-phosphate phosphatase